MLVVLWVLVAVSLLALSFSASVRLEVDAARNVVEQKRAYYVARAGIEYAVYRLLEAQSAFFAAQQAQQGMPDQVPLVLTGHLSLPFGGGRAEVEVVDETGKVNPNVAPPNLLFNLLVMVGVAPERADVITQSVLDWIDPDDLVHELGAESDYYLSLDPPYAAKNSFIDVPEELLLIQGVTPEIYYGRKTTGDDGEPVRLYGLQDYITTFSGAGQININAAPLPVLAAIPGISFETAQAIVAARAAGPLRSLGDLGAYAAGLGGEAMQYVGVFRSNVFSLDSRGMLEGSQVTARIRAVVRVDGLGPRGYTVLYWNEGGREL
ncbi:MAG: type II secretion system protein GspK [Acidobacteriota bacterium]